jgi:hypothetical protein
MQIAKTPFITRSQLEAKFAQVKNLKAMSNQLKPVLKQRHVLEKEHQAALAEIADFKKGGTTRQASAEIDRLKGEVATLKARLASAPVKPAGLTAAAWIASTARPRMTRAEFSALPHGERGKAVKTITLVD